MLDPLQTSLRIAASGLDFETASELRDHIGRDEKPQIDLGAVADVEPSLRQALDQSTPATLPSRPGLFTTSGATSLPSTSATTGLAAAIEVNPNADPSKGGDAMLLRDGGISDPGNPAYTYNSTGAASYTGRIQQLVGAIGATQSFDPSAGLGASARLTDYTNASVSWLNSENSQANSASSYQNALATQATSALSNATGVNLDAEMTNMLNLENSYASSAKLLTTVNSMFSALLSAA
jgi:flagellar hook-associated protein 1 FlgK